MKDLIVGQRAAVFIIRGDEILLMHRFKKDKEYYAVPGGKIEEGETAEVAAIREIKEETSLDIKAKFLFSMDDPIRRCHYFLATEIKGNAVLGGEELESNKKRIKYALEWVKLSRIKEIPLLPEEIKQKITDIKNEGT